MSKYRVTYMVEQVKVVEADNPFMAAVLVGGNVSDVRAARGAGSPKAVAVKKTRKISPEGLARMRAAAANARAAKAKKAKAAKKQKSGAATKKGRAR